jgi:hypothetical protein
MAEDSHNKIAQLAADAKANQPIIDSLVTEGGKRKGPGNGKSFGEALWHELQSKQAQIKEFQMSQHNKLTLEIKTSGVLIDQRSLNR